jgi:hypothetical protein
MKKYIIISTISLLLVIGLIISFANGSSDNVKIIAVSSFNNLLISDLEEKRENDAWVISLPDQTSKLGLKVNNNNTVISLALDARPFIEAGMDINKLPSYMTYDINKNVLYITSIYGSKKIEGDDIAIDNIYNNIITTYRDKLSYHHTLDHFGLLLGDGNAFEYAKDINTNDKDIVIALNPKVFEEASVDVTKVEGYLYTDVEMDNKKTEKKLLKVFNIEEVNQCILTGKSC